MLFRTQNTFLQNQNKSSCIYKYVTIHLFLGIKWWVCAMQTNTGLFDIIAVGFFFILSVLCRMKKNLLKQEMMKANGESHQSNMLKYFYWWYLIHNIISNDIVWYKSLQQKVLFSVKIERLSFLFNVNEPPMWEMSFLVK